MTAYLVVGALMVVLAELRHRRQNRERMDWLKQTLSHRTET